MEIVFTQSARRHKIGRARVRAVLADPVAVVRVRARDDRVGTRVLVLGDDATGRALEVIAIEEEGRLIVIHAMDLRRKYQHLYEAGKEA